MFKSAIAILAAGKGSRMNGHKQLALFQGETLLSRAVRIANDSGVGDVNVVLGYRADELAAHVGMDATIVFNDNWQEGIASSIRAAVKELKAANYDAVLFTTVDQPFVNEEHLRLLNYHFKTGKHEAVSSGYGTPATMGIPAIFSKTLFGQLLQLHGDRGAKQILETANAMCIDTPLARFDIDTPSDLEQCRAEVEKKYAQNLSLTISTEIDSPAFSS